MAAFTRGCRMAAWLNEREPAVHGRPDPPAFMQYAGAGGAMTIPTVLLEPPRGRAQAPGAAATTGYRHADYWALADRVAPALDGCRSDSRRHYLVPGGGRPRATPISCTCTRPPRGPVIADRAATTGARGFSRPRSRTSEHVRAAALEPSEIATIRAWLERVLCGYWTHAGYLNWDTGLSFARWHQAKKHGLCLPSLMAIALAAGHVIDGSIEPNQWYSDEVSGGLIAAADHNDRPDSGSAHVFFGPAPAAAP